MSVYSRCVDARGTTSIVSTPALSQASYPVARSRPGSGCWTAGVGSKKYSDWIASAGTRGGAPSLLSLSSATTVATRLSVPCTCETAVAPSEWPMIATGAASYDRQKGLYDEVALAPSELSLGYRCLGSDTKKSSASSVPVVKLPSCC